MCTSDHWGHKRSWAWSLYSLVQILPRALHSDKQGDGDYVTGLVLTSSEEIRPWLSFPLDSFGPWIWVRFWQAEHSLLKRISLYIFDIFHLICLCNDFMASPLWFAVGPRSLWGGLVTHFLMGVLLITQLLRLFGSLVFVNWLNHISWVAVVTPTFRP